MRLALLFTFVLIMGESYSQNLISNGGFELGTCPSGMNLDNMKEMVSGWYGIGTVDYFSDCSNSEVKPIKNFIGSQTPKEGGAYIGFISTQVNAPRYGVPPSEIVFTELQSPLQKGKEYLIRFYYSLGDKSGYYAKGLGVAFSKELAFRKQKMLDQQLFPLEYKVVLSNDTTFKDDKKWSVFEGVFVADGTERYLYISAVSVDGEIAVSRNNELNEKAFSDNFYYYIDEVSLVQQNTNGSYTSVTSRLTVKEETSESKDYTYTFSNIYFETSSHALNDSSMSSLDTLAKVLQKNPTWNITIQGYTDAVGNEKENLILSENRAKAVKEYLLSEGIDSERIKIKAMGSNTPLSLNTSEEERAQNRRVEIFIKK